MIRRPPRRPRSARFSRGSGGRWPRSRWARQGSLFRTMPGWTWRRPGRRLTGPSRQWCAEILAGLGAPRRSPCSPPGAGSCPATTCRGSPMSGERLTPCTCGASLRVGGTEPATAERIARELVTRAPFSESGYRVLMEALAQRGNVASATSSASRPARLPVTCTPACCGRGPADLRRAWRAPAPIPCNTGMAAVPWLPWVPANHTYQAPGGRI